jgi:hypothetical protein
MTWRKASERLIGGNYTWWDAEKDSAALLPLLYCIGNAIPHEPLDYFLRGIFTDDKLAPGGGDPGWTWYRDRLPDGSYTYHAWTNEDSSGLDPCEGDYDEATVKLHVYRTLMNFAETHSESKDEVEDVVARYALRPSKDQP